MPPNNPSTLYFLPLFFLVYSSPPPLIWSELGRGSWAGEDWEAESQCNSGLVPLVGGEVWGLGQLLTLALGPGAKG